MVLVFDRKHWLPRLLKRHWIWAKSADMRVIFYMDCFTNFVFHFLLDHGSGWIFRSIIDQFVIIWQALLIVENELQSNQLILINKHDIFNQHLCMWHIEFGSLSIVRQHLFEINLTTLLCLLFFLKLFHLICILSMWRE